MGFFVVVNVCAYVCARVCVSLWVFCGLEKCLLVIWVL